MKIDFVLPWVNPLDTNWQMKKEAYSVSALDKKSNSEARYRDMGTLKYVLRSIEKNCPWYNKIYLITEGHYPEWLNLNHEKIKLVTHDELYFDKTHLPVFSSSSIEMNLPNLKELSDFFVYLNDDTLIMREVGEERFFQQEKPVDFLIHGWIPRGKLYLKLKSVDAWVHSLNNNLNLVNAQTDLEYINNDMLYNDTYKLKDKIGNFLFKNIYRKAFWLSHWHQPQPYKKQTLLEVKELFFDKMMICSSNKFRANNDLTQYLYRYWHLLNGDFYPLKYNDDIEENLVSVKSLDSMITYIENNNDIKFACFNDSPVLAEEDYEKIKSKLLCYLENLFPKKASFEL